MDKINPLSKDYYERLGLSKQGNPSHGEIRNMYKKCVRKFHPDLNREDPKAEEKMKMINEAYDVLNDSEKRVIYDRDGEDGLRDGGMRNPFDPFRRFFGGGGGPGGGGGGSSGANKCKSVQQRLPVTLEDVYNGRVRKLRVTRKRICKDCNGKGATKSGAVKKCRGCDGHGRVMRIIQRGPFMQKAITACEECYGKGTTIDLRYICILCEGKCTVEDKKTLEIHIDKGMKTGRKIVCEGESDEKPDFRAGDLHFIVEVQPHKCFKRDGMNLEFHKKINLSEALTGVEFLLPQLDGRKLHVTSHPDLVISPGTVMMIRNEGMPRYKNPFEKGNLLIFFEIEFPKRIPRNIKEKLVSMLPEKNKVDNNKKKEEEQEQEEEYEEVVLEKPERVFSPGGGRQAYDSDDDDDFEGGAQRGQAVSCLIQ